MAISLNQERQKSQESNNFELSSMSFEPNIPHADELTKRFPKITPQEAIQIASIAEELRSAYLSFKAPSAGNPNEAKRERIGEISRLAGVASSELNKYLPPSSQEELTVSLGLKNTEYGRFLASIAVSDIVKGKTDTETVKKFFRNLDTDKKSELYNVSNAIKTGKWEWERTPNIAKLRAGAFNQNLGYGRFGWKE